jgi:hypothetical protein
VGHTAILIGKFESLVEESQDTAFRFRTALKLNYVRAGTESERNPDENWQYLSHQ